MKKRSSLLLTIAISLLLIFLVVLLVNNTFNQRENKRNVAIENGTVEQNVVKYKTIGLIAGNMQDKSIANIFSILKDYSKENANIKMLLFDSEAKIDKQMLQLEEFISMKVDGIILSPVENSFPETVLNKLKSSNIPVILVNSDSANNFFAGAIDASSVKIGEDQAEYMANVLNGHGRVLIFTGLPVNNTYAERLNGFKKTISKFPGMEAVEINYIPGNMDKSLRLLQDTLKNNKNIDGIVLQQNDISVDVLPLLEKMDVKPYIIGVDTAPEVLEALKEGGRYASIYISSSDMAVGAYVTMMKIIKKEEVPRTSIILHTLITSENIDEFIENNLNYKIK